MARRALTPSGLALVQALSVVPRGPWLVACSGGADSLALAWAAAHVVASARTPLRAVVVDHGLQAGSDAVASSVVTTLAGLDVPATVCRVAVGGRGGPEAAARGARYAALEAAAEPGERVLLGHTLDDQAETVLLGLARGSGTRSLAGMPAERGPFVRPLLGLGREVTAAVCAQLGLPVWHDPHNAERRFARVRVRDAVLPLLERELGPGVREALARTAALARQDADALDAIAASELASNPETLSCTRLAGLSDAVRSRVIRGWLLARGALEVAAVQTAAVSALVSDWRGQGPLDLPGLRVARSGDELRAMPPAAAVG